MPRVLICTSIHTFLELFFVPCFTQNVILRDEKAIILLNYLCPLLHIDSFNQSTLFLFYVPAGIIIHIAIES